MQNYSFQLITFCFLVFHLKKEHYIHDSAVSRCSVAGMSRKRLTNLNVLEEWSSESTVSSAKRTLTWQSERRPERDSDGGTLKQRGIITPVMFFSYKDFSNPHHSLASAPVLLPLLSCPPEPIWGRKLITKCDSFSSQRDIVACQC